jgi:hypothetical protein
MVNCLNCNNKFNEGNKKNKKFCSTSCQTKYWWKSPLGVETRKKQYLNRIEEKQKNSYLSSSNYTCLVCGYSWKVKRWIKKGDKLIYYPYGCYMCGATNWDFGNNVSCYICNKKVLQPQIHHKDKNRENNSKENRVALCSTCHQRLHHGMKELVYYKKGNRELFRKINDKRKEILNEVMANVEEGV